MSPQRRPEEWSKYASLIDRLLPGNRLTGLSELTGGLSANVVLAEVELPDTGATRYVVRRYGSADSGRNPHIARDEFGLLSVVREHGVPAPFPVAFDASAETFPEPVLVVRYLEGSPQFRGELDSYLDQTARALAKIHAIDPDDKRLAFLMPVGDPLHDVRSCLASASIDSRAHASVLRALENRRVPLPINADTLLHGDVFSGNLIWRDCRLSGVIDWEDAAIGDPLYDLAKCRVEYSCEHGVEAADQLTRFYASANPEVNLTGLVWWDLAIALRLRTKMDTWDIPADLLFKLRLGIQAFVNHVTQSLLN